MLGYFLLLHLYSLPKSKPDSNFIQKSISLLFERKRKTQYEVHNNKFLKETTP